MGSLSLGGEVGVIIGWETSIDDGTTWTNIANTTNTQSYSNLAVTTWYRVSWNVWQRIQYGCYCNG